MAYTEFYCNPSTGDNTNGGSDAGSPVFTNTNANWDGTSVFTPNNGQNPVTQGVVVGMFAAVFLDGAATATRVARVTAVTNATNGTITVSTTAVAGSSVTSGATGRTIRVGGCWKGPNALVAFPVNLASASALVNTSSDRVRFNLKNNASYDIGNASQTWSGISNVTVQGYSSSVGDGGKAIINGGTNASAAIALSSAGADIRDMEFKSTASSGTQAFLNVSVSSYLRRVVVHGARGSGIATSSGAIVQLIECEFYGCNTSNTASAAGVQDGATTLVDYCYIHDNTGSNNAGIVHTANTNLRVTNSILDSNQIGLSVTSGATSTIYAIANNDFYNNTVEAIKFAGVGTLDIRNNNFIKNGGAAINCTANGVGGLVTHNGYGSGTQANGAGNTLKSLVDDGTAVTYPSNVTPYNAPTTGDFTLVATNTTAGLNTGLGSFTETDGTNTGTVGYPDIGSASHLDTSETPTHRETSYGFNG
jgi:hypothetical protein